MSELLERACTCFWFSRQPVIPAAARGGWGLLLIRSSCLVFSCGQPRVAAELQRRVCMQS